MPPTAPDPRSFLPLTAHAFQVLLALSDEHRHGYGIIREVEDRTDGIIRLRTGTLYTLLQRLLDEGLIESTAPPREESDSASAAARASGGGPPSPGTQVTPGFGELGRSRGGGQAPRAIDSRRRYYAVTSLGRAVLTAEARRLDALLSEARRKHVLGRTTKA